MVAILARGSCLGVIAAATLMAVILNAGIVLQTKGITTNTVLALTGLILLFTAIGDELAHYRLVPSTDEAGLKERLLWIFLRASSRSRSSPAGCLRLAHSAKC